MTPYKKGGSNAIRYRLANQSSNLSIQGACADAMLRAISLVHRRLLGLNAGVIASGARRPWKAIEQLKKANELVTEIEKAESLISAYCEAERVVVGIPSTREAKVTLAAEEIANAIIAALERRIAKSKESLRELAPPAAGDS